MATQEKLLKSLEILKNLSNSSQSYDHSKKKDKIQHCHIITEAISNATIKIAPNFHTYLSITIEVLLQLCDDQESDIRMVSEECLNRIIRAMNDGNIGKVQIELLKNIKKNGPPRSLRIALIKFSQLAHLIQPHKGKPYVANLFPTIINLTERIEEQIHETLAGSLPKIMETLGNFATDNEIKALLRSFLKNVTNQSTVIRRTTAICIITICTNCRRPYVFICYVVNYLLDLLIPLDDTQDNNLILGVMLCLKSILPQLNKMKEQQGDRNSFGARKEPEITILPTERLLQIYEACLFCFANKDHNVINASLETLHTLLENASNEFKTILTCSNGVSISRITSQSTPLTKIRSPSQLSVATNQHTEDLFPETELTETIHKDIEKWIDESKLTVMDVYTTKLENVNTPLVDKNSIVANSDYENYDYIRINDDKDVDMIKNQCCDHLEHLTISDKSSEKSVSPVDDEKLIKFQEIFIGNFLDNDIALIYCSRLIIKSFLLNGIQGKLISDKLIRISVKSLALLCLSSILKIYPKIFFLYLDKNYEETRNKQQYTDQRISDVLSYKNHTDPQLRGNLRVILANFIRTILIENNGDYNSTIRKFTNDLSLNLENLIRIFNDGLHDESSTCSKQTIISLNICLDAIIESSDSYCIVPLLRNLPLIATNPYWLIKVSLCEFLAKLPYISIFNIENNTNFQNKIIYNVLFELHNDDDIRVRNAAANSLSMIIPNLYFESFNVNEPAILTKALNYKNRLLYELCQNNTIGDLTKRRLIDNRPFPFDQIFQENCPRIEYSLSKIITKLYNNLLVSKSKFFIFGCIETLALLTETYPTTVYSRAWNCLNNEIYLADKIDITVDLLKLSINFLRNSIISYDINCHLNLLNLSSNLYAGYAVNLLNPIGEVITNTTTVQQQWEMFSDCKFRTISQNYLNHILKLLNIFHYVLDDIVPIQQQKTTVLTNLTTTNTLSPIKRRKSDLEKKVLQSAKLPQVQHEQDKDDRNSSSDKKELNKLSSFVNLPHYMKLYEVLRAAYSNYKTSLESEACENFLSLLRQTLKSFSILMEIGSIAEFGEIADEILNYCRSTFHLDSSNTVECVQQLLKCLFGTNLTTNIAEIRNIKRTNNENIHEQMDSNGFYTNVFQQSYNNLSMCFNVLNNCSRIDCDDDSTIMGYLHRKDLIKMIGNTKSFDKVLANYIRIFEPMVIKSLKQYTITSDVKLQCKVLQLLSQLIQLRVNYCLLDSEQIFIDFVLKQFEYIEEGQIRNSDILIPKIFQFLVQLSYSEQHSRCIISIPKILQLCDGLMASGQSPQQFCIPALYPIVEDIFLLRNNKTNNFDSKELETTREVLFSMLLKLIEYPEIINLIAIILDDSKYCNDNQEKWSRWSLQTLQVLLPLLKQNKIKLESIEAVVVFKRLIFVLHPNIFENIADFLLLLFQESPPNDDCSLTILNRWLSKILLTFLILSPIKEDLILSKIDEIKNDISPNCVFDHVIQTKDPLNVITNIELYQNITTEMIFIKFLFKILALTIKRLEFCRMSGDNDFLVQQFDTFLIYCLYCFQSGSHCQIAKIAITNQNELQLDELNQNFQQLSNDYPILCFLCSYFLTLINYNNDQYWLNTMKIDETDRLSINQRILTTGSIIVFCDYLSEEPFQSKQFCWFLDNYALQLVDLCDEIPVFEFITSIHRTSTTSQLFLQSLIRICCNYEDSVFKIKLLKCIENTHPNHIGELLKLLLPKFLISRQLAVSRNIANLACRKIELLLTMTMEDVNMQLSKEDILGIVKSLVAHRLTKRYETLSSLLNKLCTQYYDISPLEFDQKRSVNPDYIRKLQINKNWYLNQIKIKCNDSDVGRETAELLNKMNSNQIIEFLTNHEFNRANYIELLRFSINLYRRKQITSTILQATIDCLLKEINLICIEIPETFPKNSNFQSIDNDLIISISYLIESLQYLNDIEISNDHLLNLMRFGVISLKVINDSIKTDYRDFNVNLINSTINFCKILCKNRQILSVFSKNSNIDWLNLLITNLYEIIEFLLIDDEPLPTITRHVLEKSLADPKTRPAGEICYQLHTLICWLYKVKNIEIKIPKFLFNPIKSIIISLSNLPIVNSYVLIPTNVWKTDWLPELSGDFNTLVPPLPETFLQEIDILEEFIYRVALLGWTSRQQFEETWMCLLTVLCNISNNNQNDDDKLEQNYIINASCLAVKAITTLLLQTFIQPLPGCMMNEAVLIHVPRDESININNICVEKLRNLHENIVDKYEEFNEYLPKLFNVFEWRNFEKFDQHYSYNQLSIKYLLIATKSIEIEDNCYASSVWKTRERSLENYGLDINSCLQFLLDFYSQLLQQTIPLNFLHEMVRSIVTISDLFNDRQQFSWLLEMFFELAKIHTSEDELLHQYLIVGICKSAAVLTPDLEIYENIKKMLVLYLKSSILSSRIACLHGLLYLLEGCKLSNISIGGISDEMQLILPCAVEYVQCNLNTNNCVLKRSKQHTMLVWSLAFFIIENVDEIHLEMNFVTNTLQAALHTLQLNQIGTLHVSLIKSFERLMIVKRSVLQKVDKSMINLALEKLKNDDPVVAMMGLQLLLTYMYIDCSQYFENSDNSTLMQSNPDHLVQTIEKVSAIFEYIKKGCIFNIEIICWVLPDILNDFFSPSDVLTKVIGEFLSPQQPHPKLLSRVVFKIFERAIEENQLSLLQDWVVFSLSNFTQSLSIGMATWCLTCFFISASTNQWLRAYFPYVQTRVGRYEYEDRKLLCIVGVDFYNNLTNDKQKQTFIENFNKVKNQSDALFEDLLKSL